MPLSQVRAGMTCTALSVVRGTTVSQFSADVVDVIAGGALPLERSDPRSGYRAPPSTRPVSARAFPAPRSSVRMAREPCAQRARSRRALAEYGNKVALATPIEAILGQGPDPPPATSAGARLLRRARPMATPLTIGGLSGALGTRVIAAARRAGRPVLAAPAGPLGGFPRQDIRPGAAVSAGLSSGRHRHRRHRDRHVPRRLGGLGVRAPARRARTARAAPAGRVRVHCG